MKAGPKSRSRLQVLMVVLAPLSCAWWLHCTVQSKQTYAKDLEGYDLNSFVEHPIWKVRSAWLGSCMYFEASFFLYFCPEDAVMLCSTGSHRLLWMHVHVHATLFVWCACVHVCPCVPCIFVVQRCLFGCSLYTYFQDVWHARKSPRLLVVPYELLLSDFRAQLRRIAAYV